MTRGETSLYLVPTNGDKGYSYKQSNCVGCYVKEDPSDPEVKIAAKIALTEYVHGSKSRLKDLVVNKVVSAERQVIGFLNRNYRLNFFAKPRADCEMYSFFCSAPQKCKAEVNLKDNNYSVTRVDCHPRVGKTPYQSGWEW